MVNGTVDILNKCPLCGSELEYNALMQYTNVYRVLRNGKVSKKRIKKRDEGSMECGFLSCVSCDFHTDCDLDVDEFNIDVQIYQDGDTFMYEHIINDGCRKEKCRFYDPYDEASYNGCMYGACEGDKESEMACKK